MTLAEAFLDRIGRLRVDRSNGQRKPHKPLLLLMAIGRWVTRGQREVSFLEVEETLVPLLDVYAPPVAGSHSPELPYWALQNDGVWEIPGADSLPVGAKGKPTRQTLRTSVGRIPALYADALASDPALAARAVQLLLEAHFPGSLHEDLRAALDLVDVGGALPGPAVDAVAEVRIQRARDRGFRAEVLAAYEHKCALSGFQALLGGVPFGLEAAHVHWHSQGGPSTVDNGLALTPTLHKLFDHGAWTLDDQHRVLVSRQFTGTDAAVRELRDLHGKPIRAPLDTQPVSLEFIHWHRDPRLGGVFREPALSKH